MYKTDIFHARHIGNTVQDTRQMLDFIGFQTMEQLIENTIPKDICLHRDLDLDAAMSEYEYLTHIHRLASENKLFKNYIGLGYHPVVLPSVIQRNVLENPGWYTAYTPYQAEISQGRLEALLNFQTMVTDLTGMELANASLLDEATAAAEAMILLYNTRDKEQRKNNANIFLVSNDVLPQTIEVLKTRSIPLGIDLQVFDVEDTNLSKDIFGILLQYPAADGRVIALKNFVYKAKHKNIRTVVAADLLSLTLLEAPGNWGAEITVGTTQRFGIPMGYGGPHAAYFATKEIYKRNIPGRVIGMTKDKDGNPALRMALQMREQHIKREKATSNICTAQVLLAVMASMYGVYHGSEGLKYIATKIHLHTITLGKALEDMKLVNHNKYFFDTLLISGDLNVRELRKMAERREINFGYHYKDKILIALNETTSIQDLNDILRVFSEATGRDFHPIESLECAISFPKSLQRKTDYMTHSVFKNYQSETKMMRYIKKLERKDLSLNHSMISLGSCTMKLNAAAQMLPLSDMRWNSIHPFAPIEQAKGYHKVFKDLEKDLNIITGFDTTCFQPNSGAQGEYTGLLVIRAYHKSNAEHHRNICLIPASAHGTNPASAVMAGMQVIVIKTTEKGDIDFEDLKKKVEKHKDNLGALMITYPSTHGVFEEGILKVTKLIHDNGGQVYMDGANMNAQVGFTNPAVIGADVCHLNLHKTFAIPHGGGGPGVGSISVAKHLAPFLPSHPIISVSSDKGIHSVSAAPWGSALILLISYSYIKMLGAEGLKKSTENAILNANYLKKSLEEDYDILYTGAKGYCAHEMIIDFRPFKNKGIGVVDIAKRLMDYGYHAPTVSFPVAGTLMIEPTESEGKQELDSFIKALKSIKREIDEMDIHREDSILKNAPHTQSMVISDTWNLPYSKEQAVYPVENISENKFWPSVRRVDDAFGDRNLVCNCMSVIEKTIMNAKIAIELTKKAIELSKKDSL